MLPHFLSFSNENSFRSQNSSISNLYRHVEVCVDVDEEMLLGGHMICASAINQLYMLFRGFLIFLSGRKHVEKTFFMSFKGSEQFSIGDSLQVLGLFHQR